MTKKVVVICIICFMLCMFIEPGLASLQNNFIGINQESIGPVKITENLKKGEVSLYPIDDKKNLTESQKKLSTALLLQTPALNSTSPLIKSASLSSLPIKNIPVDQATSGLQSASSKLPSGKLVYVYVNVKPGYSTQIIESLAFEVTDRDEGNHLAVAWVDVQNLEALASLEGVRTISEVIPPVANIGSVTTEGDIIHKTADVRSKFGYTGPGMKIGIISTGVDHIADSKATGDLPADVTVLSNTNPLGLAVNDEGTAMLEIVHDMVPDAKLYFHDCGSNTVAFNAAINELYANGCTIICDDIKWYNEPYFEDGIIASNVATLLSSNKVIYVSSAGNNAQSHYQGYFSPYTGFAPNYNFTDFSHGTDPNFHALYVNIPAQSTVTIFLEWNDQFGHSANDYDLVLSDATTYEVLDYSANTQSGTQDPFEALSYTNTGSSIVAEIDVYKYSGLWKNLELYILPSNGAFIYSNNLVASDSIFGHPAVPDVIAVAAVPAISPSTIESFSSRGPVTISYPSAVSRQKPDISGVDGVAVTGAGGFSNPFYGTSASAPHIAAIAAQIWGAHPTLSPSQVRSALYTSAVDLGATGKDTTFGYGRADALAMEGDEVKIGVYRPSSHTFYLKNGTALSWTTTAINWGTSTDLPVIGDWNGDGITEVGVYRPSAHMFYLKNGTAVSWTTTAINWGISTDLPVTGDWNGDGITDVGVYRPSAHTFYLKNGTTTAINWGISTDLLVTGDWNGDGITEVGVYRPSAHTFYLKNGTAVSWTTTAINWGISTDLPVTGDWNGDGTTDVGVYRPSDHTFYLRSGDYPTTRLPIISWGISTDTPVTGKWSGTAVPPVARFSGTPISGTAPLMVAFTDLSLNTPTSWNWSFGDGNTSTLKNPSNVYSSPGLYPVSLNATNTAGSNSTTKLNYITVTSAPITPLAQFIGTPISGTAPLQVSFTDLSLNNPIGWAWYFGDENWTTRSWTIVNASPAFTGRAGHAMTVLPNGSLLIAGGYNTGSFMNDVWVSNDAGNTWTQVNSSAGWAARYSHSLVTLTDGSVVLFGGTTADGDKNDVWRSTDNGTTWYQQTAGAQWTAREWQNGVALPDGSIVVMGGWTTSGASKNNNVWRSTDKGVTWSQQTGSASWTPRYHMSSTVLPDGNIFLGGGYDDSVYYNDTYLSTDKGVTWTQLTGSAGWAKRYGASTVAMPDGSLITMGGNTGSYKSDTWRSTDNGATWTQLYESSGWTARSDPAVVTTPDGSIILAGGYLGSWINSVYKFSPTSGATAQNPLHTYTLPGIYQVALQAYNSDGYNSIQKTDYITVNAA